MCNPDFGITKIEFFGMLTKFALWTIFKIFERIENMLSTVTDKHAIKKWIKVDNKESQIFAS